MSVPVAYLPAAEDDIAEAHSYYEAQRAGLGADFATEVEAVEAVVATICATPQLFAVLRRGVRAAPVSRFLYVVYYRDRTADVLVVAVQHGRRSRRGWTGRG